MDGKRAMNDEQVQNLLATHADALISGEDQADTLLVYANGNRVELEFLFQIAAALQKALRPLAAPADIAMLMVDDVRDKGGTVKLAERIEKQRLFWLIGGVASVIAGAAGLIFWLRSRGNGGVIKLGYRLKIGLLYPITILYPFRSCIKPNKCLHFPQILSNPCSLKLSVNFDCDKMNKRK